MATIGIKHPVFAPISPTSVEGARPTYNAGTVLGKAVKADVNLTFAEGKLFADDVLAEYASKFQSGTITAGVDELTAEKRVIVFGNTLDTTSGASTLVKGTEDTAPHGGFGYFKTKQVDGKKKFNAKWYFDTVWHEGNDTAETGNDGITFQTTEITGSILPVVGWGNNNWMEEETFNTEAEAVSWLHTRAGITSAAPSVRMASAPSTTTTTSSKS